MAVNRLARLLQFLEEDPDDPFVRFALASEYLKAGDLDASLEWFEALARDQPDYVGTYYQLGMLYRRLGREEEALKTFEDGIQAASRINDFHAASELRSAKMEIEIGGDP